MPVEITMPMPSSGERIIASPLAKRIAGGRGIVAIDIAQAISQSWLTSWLAMTGQLSVSARCVAGRMSRLN
jgi:hypothetical protein